jgi:hypothetical protein
MTTTTINEILWSLEDNFIKPVVPVPETVPDSMNLYIVSYWQPFPGSEYGGVITVVASSEEDAISLLANEDFSYWDISGNEERVLIQQAVREAKVLPLRGSPKPEVISAFIT